MSGEKISGRERSAAGAETAPPFGGTAFRLVLAAAAVFGLILIWVIPPWQSPDEATHFEYVRVLVRGDAPWAPRSDYELQRRIIYSLDRHDYWRYVGVERPDPLPGTFREAPFLGDAPAQIGKNPPLYYFLASLALRLFPGRTPAAELYRLRLLSLVFALLTLFPVAGCAVRVFGRGSPLVPAAAAAAAFLPQFLVIGTSVSPDPCFNFLGASAIYLVLRFQEPGFTLRRALVVLFVLGLALLVSYKALILLAAVPGAVAVHFLFNRDRAPSPGRLAGWLGATVLVLLAGYSALVWYFPGIARIFVIRVNIFASTVVLFLRGRTQFPPGYWSWFSGELYKSFWLKYGWMAFELPAIAYRALNAAAAVSLLGLGVGVFRRARGRRPGGAGEAAATLAVFAGAVLGAVYLFWGLQGKMIPAQGRHLFLALPAWAVLFTLGWSCWFPARWDRLVGWGLTVVCFLLAAGSVFLFILPTFS